MKLIENLLKYIGGRIACLGQGVKIHFEPGHYISYKEFNSTKGKRLVRKIIGSDLSRTQKNQMEYFQKLKKECGRDIDYINYNLTGDIFTIPNPTK